jgi:hypothetical protein
MLRFRSHHNLSIGQAARSALVTEQVWLTLETRPAFLSSNDYRKAIGCIRDAIVRLDEADLRRRTKAFGRGYTIRKASEVKLSHEQRPPKASRTRASIRSKRSRSKGSKKRR